MDPPPTVKQTWAPVAPWTASPGATLPPNREWTPPPTVKQTWAPVAPWTASPGATWAPVVPWTPPPTEKQTWAPVAPWTASPGATWAPVIPWTPPPSTARREVPWTPPPTVALLDLVATIEAANEEDGGEYEGKFDTVLAALAAADLTTLLDGDALFTIFAPTDDAFEEADITADSVGSIPLPVLRNLLLYHLLKGGASVEVVAAAEDFYTVLKVNLAVDNGVLVDGEGNSISLVGDELRAKNGYVHAVDGVLFPMDLMTLAEGINGKGGSFEGVFDIFLAGVNRAGLASALSGVNGPYTMFAPADFAFEAIGITNETVLTFDPAILTTVLTYHIVGGEVNNATLLGTPQEFSTLLADRLLRNSRQGGVIDGTGQVATVLAADLQALNGYVHAIDIVLEPYPLFTQSPTASPTAAPTTTPLLDLVETLIAENDDPMSEYMGEFDTAIAALMASGLDIELEGSSREFTFFAPTDTAFLEANLDPESIADMPPTILENLLKYHMLRGSVRRQAIRNDRTLFTTLGIDLRTSGVTLTDSEGNTVNMVEFDVAYSKGYLHYVDGVLMPPDLMSSLEAFNAQGGTYEGVFDSFLAGMVETNMTSDITRFNGPFTILAPTDDAFAVLRVDATNIHLTNKTALRELLRYHLVDGVVSSSDIEDESPLGTQGVTVSDSGLILGSEGGEADVLVGNLFASNGMIHAISSVLLPFPEEQLTGDIFDSDRDVPEDQDDGNDHVEVAALSAGIAAALILVAAAIAVHKRRQADAVKPPQVAPDDGGWGTGGVVRATAVHPA